MDINTSQFGDYQLHYVPPEMGNSSHRIVALYGDTKVGEMSWGPRDIRGLDVANEHQRKGLATAMWSAGQSIRPRPKHSSDRTNDGDAWARKVGGPLPRRDRA